MRALFAVVVASSLALAVLAADSDAAKLVVLDAPKAVKERMARAGKPYRALGAAKAGAHVEAIEAKAVKRGARAPRRVISLGGTAHEQQFYVEYPNPVRDRDVPYKLVHVAEGADGHLTVSDRGPDAGSSLAVAPHKAWGRGAIALTGGARLRHYASPLGVTTAGTFLYRGVGSDSLAEIPVFKGAGRALLHPGTQHFDTTRRAERRHLGSVGLELL